MRGVLSLVTLVCLGMATALGQAPPAAARKTAGVGAPVRPEPPARELTAKQQAERMARWRGEIRRLLYIPDKLPALDAKVWSTFSPTPGVLADRVTYNTADGMIVPAIVYRPDPKVLHWKGRLPGIVVVNGHGGDKSSWYAFYTGMLFAKMGAEVVTYDPIGEFERNIDRRSRTSAHDKWVDPPAGLPRTDWGQRLDGLMQMDAMQAVAYLAHRPEVDAKRIAVLGYSMGSFVVGITGAIDLQIHATVLSGGGVYDGPGGYFDANPLPCQSPPYKALLALGDRGAILYALNAQRGPMYVMNGAADTVMDIPHHEQDWFDTVKARAIAIRGTDKNIFTTVFYPGISHRPSWVDKDGAEWLEKYIHFAIWTERQIEDAPTVNTAQWAIKNGAPTSKNFLRQDREGGIAAVAADLPAIPRDQLVVLPEKAWEARKDSLTYVSWAAKMKAAEAKQAAALR